LTINATSLSSSTEKDLEELNLGSFKMGVLEYENYSIVVSSISSGEMFLMVFMEPQSPNLGLVMLHAENVTNQILSML